MPEEAETAIIERMLRTSAGLEALLFASGEPIEKQRLTALLGVSSDELTSAIAELEASLRGRGTAVIETATELELRTAPEAAELVKKLRESELARDLGKASLETLAVIAYHPTASGGATRSEVDWVRGVNSSTSVRNLLLRGLIEGSEDSKDKRRIRYALTTEALAHLGISRTEELPRYGELSASEQAVAALEAAP